MADIYNGTDGDDTIDQNTLRLANYVRIYPGSGDDKVTVSYAFVQGDAGNDLITDLTGASIVDYFASPMGIRADLTTGRVADGYGTTDILINVHELQGSNFNDVIVGSDSNDSFSLNRGDDHLDGGAGIDQLNMFYAIDNYDIQYKNGQLTVANKDVNASDAGLKTLVSVEKIRFAGKSVPVRELFPEMSNTSSYQFKRGAVPDLYNLYHWGGWNTASVAVNSILTPDINHDGKMDIVAQLWQRVPEGGMATELATPNRLVILESQSDGTYKDTTATRFNTTSAVVLGGQLGGVGIADSGDINKDGQIDFIFALNRDDGRAGTLTSGNSYPTAIMSKPDGTYEIQNIGAPVWNYFTQLINVNGNYQAWFSQIGHINSTINYGTYPGGWVDGVPAYQYDVVTKNWTISSQPPISSSFNVLPEFVSNGKVNRIFTMLADSSKAVDMSTSAPGLAYLSVYAALMDQDATGQWRVSSSSNPFNYVPKQFKLNSQTVTGQVGFDGEDTFALVEYFFRPGSLEIFPGSGQVVMATRTMLALSKDATSGALTATGNDAVKMDFYSAKQDQIARLPIKIVGMQEDVYSWAYSYLDINNDGLTDIAQQGWNHVTQTGGAPNVYLNTGAGVFVHLDPSLFPKAPDYWNKPGMSQFLDANGDGIYDLLYYPAYAEAQYIPDTNWELFEATSTLSNDAYKESIAIADRFESPLIKTWAGDDTVAGVNIHQGSNQIDLGSGFDTVQYASKSSNFTLAVDGNHLWHVKSNVFDDALRHVEKIQFLDRSVIIESKPHGSYADLPVGLYQFFITAFNAAPGVTYMDQLAAAYRAGMSVKQIVDVFTTKSQFTDVYPTSLSHGQLAQALVNNIVKTSASDVTKQQAVKDITDALDSPGWTVGRVIYQVFGNLANFAYSDATWGNTAKQFANEIAVAKTYTDTLSQSTTDLATLRSVMAPVSHLSDVSTPELQISLIGQALLG
ncbi:FG-GAP-like repeat-containing protein [Limnohabitans radicicola]|uniref:VCBS repeat-containing protein n=1 Tax=Limnohabitans radicicola TaxID=2771427 RepID=A0A927IKJ1_9BURK|nr:FG-GAP-like repeat-containing protein [Limnohabitans radicicola]MBD8049688.1 VCBS repeat-containing protein [Limnohabitans radicicola]